MNRTIRPTLNSGDLIDLVAIASPALPYILTNIHTTTNRNAMNLVLRNNSSGFFAPVDALLLGSLFTTYRLTRANIERMGQFMASDDCRIAMRFFLDACKDDQGRCGLQVDKLLRTDAAVSALNAEYWDRALKLTDVLECMPQKRRDDWYKAIRDMETPDFIEETVVNTMQELLNSREQFLAERVDGIFRALSGEHVTNAPSGFGKRMILYVCGNFGMINHTNVGHITDLRKIIARFMGRDEPTGYGITDSVIRTGMSQTGEWLTIDGGAMRIRCYQKGTAHLEIHPEMAWRLNAILAHIYPLAIPPEFRQKPKRKPKDIELTSRLLPFSVVSALQSAESASERVSDRNWRKLPNTVYIKARMDKYIEAQVDQVLEQIGGVRAKLGVAYHYWQFDYDPLPVIGVICASGCVPDHKSHQYYPTLEAMGQVVIETADIGETDKCLEPEAGQGGLADLMPKERTHCVEISKLHCEILKAKGYTVTNGDFLELAQEPIYDRVAMNPPFSDGRWQAHVEHAAGFVTDGGRLVAILPSGAKNKFDLPGFACEWSQVFDNQFDGTSISVVILKADRIR